MRSARHSRIAVAACAVALAVVLPASSASAGSGFGDRKLEVGMRGDDVERLQQLLTGFGFDTKRDGDFGPGTEDSVKRYERSRDKTVDGVVRKREAEAM